VFHEIRGLPAHPLIIHLPIILGPVVGLMTLGLLVPRWRPKLLKWTAAFAVVFALSCVAAAESGEDLAKTLGLGGLVDAHMNAATTLRLLAIILATVLVVFALLYTRLSKTVQTITVVLIAILGVGAIAQTVKTGEAGANLVWKSQFDAANAAQQKK
jgi:hypothetical protein